MLFFALIYFAGSLVGDLCLQLNCNFSLLHRAYRTVVLFLTHTHSNIQFLTRITRKRFRARVKYLHEVRGANAYWKPYASHAIRCDYHNVKCSLEYVYQLWVCVHACAPRSHIVCVCVCASLRYVHLTSSLWLLTALLQHPLTLLYLHHSIHWYIE